MIFFNASHSVEMQYDCHENGIYDLILYIYILQGLVLF